MRASICVTLATRAPAHQFLQRKVQNQSRIFSTRIGQARGGRNQGSSTIAKPAIPTRIAASLRGCTTGSRSAFDFRLWSLSVAVVLNTLNIEKRCPRANAIYDSIMTQSQTENIERAARLIESAEALIIAVGAGMGVDSGLPDFRGNDGFWNAYPALAKAHIDFYSIACSDAFVSNPRRAWGFYYRRRGQSCPFCPANTSICSAGILFLCRNRCAMVSCDHCEIRWTTHSKRGFATHFQNPSSLCEPKRTNCKTLAASFR